MEIFSLPSTDCCCADVCEAILVRLWAVLDQPDAGDVVRAGQMATWKALPTARDSVSGVKQSSSGFVVQHIKDGMSVLVHLIIALFTAAEGNVCSRPQRVF